MHNAINTYTHTVNGSGELKTFELTSKTGKCIGLIYYSESTGRNGDIIINVPKLGTSNGGKSLKDLQGLEQIDTLDEKIPGLLYIMFKIFINYIKNQNYNDFSINIENPLLTLTDVYRKLYLELKKTGYIEDGVVRQGVSIMRI